MVICSHSFLIRARFRKKNTKFLKPAAHTHTIALILYEFNSNFHFVHSSEAVTQKKADKIVEKSHYSKFDAWKSLNMPKSHVNEWGKKIIDVNQFWFIKLDAHAMHSPKSVLKFSFVITVILNSHRFFFLCQILKLKTIYSCIKWFCCCRFTSLKKNMDKTHKPIVFNRHTKWYFRWFLNIFFIKTCWNLLDRNVLSFFLHSITIWTSSQCFFMFISKGILIMSFFRNRENCEKRSEEAKKLQLFWVDVFIFFALSLSPVYELWWNG